MSDNPKVPPHNIEAEKSLLGSILIDQDAIVKVSDLVEADDFYEEKHGLIFSALRHLYDSHSPIDVLTVTDQLKKNNHLEMVGGSAYLSELTNFVPTAAHVDSYAKIVADKALRRRLITASSNIASAGQDEKKPIADIVNYAESQLFAVSDRNIKHDVIDLESILDTSFERLDELHKDKGQVRGIPTGYKDLDNLLAGLQPSDLVVLAARPSMGKTALSLNMSHNMAINSKKPILLFSLEMSREQLVDRLLAAEAGVDAWSLRTGNLSDDDFEKIGQAMGSLSEANILIDDTPSITVNDMRTKARREHHKTPLGVVIVDYLQLMSGGARFSSDGNRVQEISEISRGLKSIARELDVPVLALSQLSRSVESRHPQIPQLADLRESGSIEQDADVVMFLYREEYYDPDTQRANITDVFIKKHRNGPIGGVELYFDRNKQKIASLEKRQATPFDD